MKVRGLVVFENRSMWMDGITEDDTFIRVWLYKIYHKDLNILKKRS